jgi:hypothetical protein
LQLQVNFATSHKNGNQLSATLGQLGLSINIFTTPGQQLNF